MTATTSPVTSRAVTATPRWLVPLLKIDAIGSVVIGVTLLATAGWVRGPLGFSSVLPVVLVGVLFVVNGPVNLRAARTLTRGRLRGPIAVDSVFGLLLLTVAIADPAGADTWARWTVALVALMSFDLAAAKAWGRSRLGR